MVELKALKVSHQWQ